MKITNVQTYSIGVPPPYRGGSAWHFVKIGTDDGPYGWGEMACLGSNSGRSQSLADEVSDLAARFVIGEDPLRREWIWNRFYEGSMSGHPDYVRGSILSAIDTALWDIAGKHFGVPVYQLLGGAVRETVRAYSYIYHDPDRPAHRGSEGSWSLWLQPELCAERAAEMAAEGFTALKLDPISSGHSWGDPSRPWQLGLEELDRAEQTIRMLR